MVKMCKIKTVRTYVHYRQTNIGKQTSAAAAKINKTSQTDRQTNRHIDIETNCRIIISQRPHTLYKGQNPLHTFPRRQGSCQLVAYFLMTQQTILTFR